MLRLLSSKFRKENESHNGKSENRRRGRGKERDNLKWPWALLSFAAGAELRRYGSPSKMATLFKLEGHRDTPHRCSTFCRPLLFTKSVVKACVGRGFKLWQSTPSVEMKYSIKKFYIKQRELLHRKIFSCFKNKGEKDIEPSSCFQMTSSYLRGCLCIESWSHKRSKS